MNRPPGWHLRELRQPLSALSGKAWSHTTAGQHRPRNNARTASGQMRDFEITCAIVSDSMLAHRCWMAMNRPSATIGGAMIRLPVRLATRRVPAMRSACLACTPEGRTGRARRSPLPAPPDVAAPPADALETPSGLASKVLRVGLGSIRPGPRSTVRSTTRAGRPTGRCSTAPYSPVSPSSSPRPGHSRLDRGPAAHGRRRAAPVLDSRRARLRSIPDTPGAAQPKGMLVFDIELLDVR